MVSSTFFPAVHFLGSQNVCSRVEGIADHYWPWAVFFSPIASLFLPSPPIASHRLRSPPFGRRHPSHPRIPVSVSLFFDDSFSYLETQSWDRQKHMATR